MRVIAGEWRGRRLVTPTGIVTRPTADRVREALFSMLGAVVEGAAVLDLFAGSGALGLEALSRGAVRATFVDIAPAALEAVRENCARLGAAPERCEMREGDAAAFVCEAISRGEKYDVVFLDPPYAVPLGARLASELPELLAPGARIVCESGRAASPLFALPLLRERRYGNTLLRIHSQ